MRYGVVLILILFTIISGRPPDNLANYPWPALLSEWQLFHSNPVNDPQIGVIPYDVNSPLYSDYAFKARFIALPKGAAMQFQSSGPFLMPNETVLVKTFYYPADFRKSDKNWQVLETRLLVKHQGQWHAASYVWDADMTDARLALAGDTRTVNWLNEQGKKETLEYLVPDVNQCKNCHNSDDIMQPLGLSAKQLQRGNQLPVMAQHGLLKNFIASHVETVLPDYRDPTTGTLDQRARAYLDVNCGHCHSEKGPANTSGLNLNFEEDRMRKIGVDKPPIAAGRGSGGHKYNIVPGKPKASILLYRMESDDPGVRMPEINRQVPHEEGIDLIRAWIKSLPG